MIIDTITIIVCSVLLLLAVAASLCNPLLRKLAATPTAEEEHDGEDNTTGPRLSVIMTVHDQARELEEHLSVILSQDYAPGYEVIVVDESSTDDTEDVLNRMKRNCPHLYTTFIPESSHYLSRRKLALTLGVKAAKNEWLIFTDADCQPESDQWLKTIAQQCTADKDLVLGYTRYEDDTPCYWRFERLASQWRLMRRAVNGTAYRYNGNNLAVRKSVFMRHNGFLNNLKYLRGEYDFMVNEYAQPGRTAVATHPDARITQDTPSKRTWTNRHLYFMETQRHLSRSKAYQLPATLCSALLHVNYTTQACAIGLSIAWEQWIVTGVAATCMIITLAMRTLVAHKDFKATGETIPAYGVPLMELRAMWQYLLFRIRYMKADKYDFIRR